MEKEKIKWRILVPTIIAIVVLIIVAIIGFRNYLQSELNVDVYESIGSTDRMFRNALNGDAELMSGLIGFISENKHLQKAWLEKDRAELLLIAEPTPIIERYGQVNYRLALSFI